MRERVLVSFRAEGGPGRGFLERARLLVARFAPLGAALIGWDAAKLTLAFDASRFADVLDHVIKPGPDTEGDEPPWAIGIAQGEIDPVKEEGLPLLESGLLWWGAPFAAASLFARLARPGDILCSQSVPAIQTGELLTLGRRFARDGGLRLRGARLDARQPWRSRAAEDLRRLREPKLVSSHLPPARLSPGALVVLRADPGAGGTRLLKEIAARSARALFISPVGSGFEPFGALRRALLRAADRATNPLLHELAKPLDALLSGRGITLDVASQLITAYLWPKQAWGHPNNPGCALVIDDAKGVDPATLEASVRAMQANAAFGLIARLDASSGLPSVLARIPKSAEHEILALSREGAEEVAIGATGGALDPMARRRWARLGGGSPLAIVEAITCGISTGDIIWFGDRATPRTRSAGRGNVLAAAKWIRLRANAENPAARAVLSLLAVVGGEANVSFLGRVLERAAVRVDLPSTISRLERSRWLVRTEEGGGPSGPVAFPTRTHHKALFLALEDEARKKLHSAVAHVIEEEEGMFGKVEGAWHAAQAGEGPRAAAILLEAARSTAEAGLEASTTQLIAFARRADPACEEIALELLANALDRSPSEFPAPTSASMPPMSSPSAPPSVVPPVSVFQAPPPIRPVSVPPLSGPARVAQIASAAPRRPVASAIQPTTLQVEAKEEPLPAVAEDDSMIEHAVIVGPDVPPAADTAPQETKVETPEPDSIVERALIVPPAIDPSADPTAVSALPVDSEPPVMRIEPVPSVAPLPTRSEAPESEVGPSSGGQSIAPDSSIPGGKIAVRLGELAKEALLAADNVALERWVDGLRAAGESPVFTERMRAMARLGRGDIGDALRVLRRTRSRLDPKDFRRRCQTSLALGVALSMAGRPQDALLEAMDALARARQNDDERGAKACLAFLAKLYSSVEREEESERLRESST